jgi:glycosyltransferase involved in cell wall biosynthesis
MPDILSFGWVRRYPWGIRHLLFLWLLMRRGASTDALYALDPVSVGLPVMIASSILKKPYVVRIAGDYAWEQGVQRFKVTDHLDVFSKKWADYLIPVLILKKIQKMVAERAVRVIVPSNYFKTIVSNWGVSKEKISVIYSVAEEIPFQGRKTDFRHMLKFDGKVIVSSGRLVSWKGFEALIELMLRLKEKFSSIKLLIIGSGPLAEKLEAMVEKKKLNDVVSLTGALSQDVLFKYVRMADVFVLNTNYEGLSHQLLEVMGIGTPIITTNVGGNPELITNEKNGLLVSYNNKNELYENIVRVLNDQSLSERLVRNAKATLKKFNPDDMVKQLVTILKKSL